MSTIDDLFKSSDASLDIPMLTSSSSMSSESGSIMDKIQNMSVTSWLLIVFILAFLGINIFVYLAKGTQDITNLFKPIVDKILSVFGGVTSQIVDVSAEGAKGVVDGTAKVLDTSLTTVQQITPSSSVPNTPIKNTIPQQDVMQLNRALNTSMHSETNEQTYEADESTSSIQKSGWCYIGEDRGFRTCAKVGANDTCMSGDIFPSHDICVNPNLRA
jgi:hypothetical protein